MELTLWQVAERRPDIDQHRNLRGVPGRHIMIPRLALLLHDKRIGLDDVHALLVRLKPPLRDGLHAVDRRPGPRRFVHLHRRQPPERKVRLLPTPTPTPGTSSTRLTRGSCTILPPLVLTPRQRNTENGLDGPALPHGGEHGIVGGLVRLGAVQAGQVRVGQAQQARRLPVAVPVGLRDDGQPLRVGRDPRDGHVLEPVVPAHEGAVDVGPHKGRQVGRDTAG
jgi:hypothetical protein